MMKHNSKAKDIELILDQLNILYEKEKTFNDLKYKNKLRFDYYLPKYNLCIEFNGAQHYEYVEYFHKNESQFDEQRFKDYIKSEYCRSHDIHLIELPCSLTSEEIRAELVQFINEYDNEEIELLPFIDEFLDLNESRDVYINLLYDEYQTMIHDLKLNLTTHYQLFYDYVINYWNLEYHKLVKKNNSYCERWINHESIINHDDNDKYNLFMSLIQCTKLMNLDFIPNNVIYALYLDINGQKLNDKQAISSGKLISLLKPYMEELGYQFDNSRVKRPRSCIKNIAIFDDIDDTINEGRNILFEDQEEKGYGFDIKDGNYPNYEQIMSKNTASKCWVKKEGDE